MDPPPSVLQSDLLTIKHTQDPTTLYPSNAFGRGGVGHFLCTGHSRVGLHRLPQAASQPASLSVTARRRLGSSRSMGEDSVGGSAASLSGFSLISSDPVSIGATRAWEAGSVTHTHNFVASSRTVRPQDIPTASKWAAMSYFENDPKEVSRHMAIMDYVQAQHEAGKAAERQIEQARRNLWAEQQREMFRRQRLEQAARYARSGIRPRSAYADLGAVAAAEAAHGVGVGGPGVDAAEGGGDGSPAGVGGASGRAASAGGRPSYRDRDPTERFYTSDPVRSALSASGAAAAAVMYGSNGRLRPATAGVAYSRSGGGGGLYERSPGGGSSSHLGVSLPRRTYIPLPKKTYVNVHERMAAEVAEAPAARVAALAAAKARQEEDRTQAVVTSELQELDSFEARMRSLQRARSKAAERPPKQRASRASGGSRGSASGEQQQEEGEGQRGQEQEHEDRESVRE